MQALRLSRVNIMERSVQPHASLASDVRALPMTAVNHRAERHQSQRPSSHPSSLVASLQFIEIAIVMAAEVWTSCKHE